MSTLVKHNLAFDVDMWNPNKNGISARIQNHQPWLTMIPRTSKNTTKTPRRTPRTLTSNRHRGTTIWSGTRCKIARCSEVENHGNDWQSNTASLNMWSTPVRKKVKQTANTTNNNRVEGWSIGCTETIWRGIFGQIDRKNLLIQKFTIDIMASKPCPPGCQRWRHKCSKDTYVMVY